MFVFQQQSSQDYYGNTKCKDDGKIDKKKALKHTIIYGIEKLMQKSPYSSFHN